MNVRNLIRKRTNERIYGNLLKSNILNLSNRNIRGGMKGASTNEANDDSTNNDKLNFKIEDTFTKYHTNSLLFGKHITDYAKKIIFKVIEYYRNKDIEGNTDIKRKIIKYLNKVFEDKDLNYDKLMNKFNAQTNECLLGYMLIAYQNNNLDLMLRTTYTFGRVLPLDYKNEWFDNYRLNAYGNVLNMVMWKEFDMDDVYTIDENPKPINESVELPFNKVVKYMVGSLRAFIIDYELYPKNIKYERTSDNLNGRLGQNYSGSRFNRNIRNVKNENENENSNENSNKNSTLSGGDIEAIISPEDYHKLKGLLSEPNKTAKQICDECYLHYPFYFGGSHGCDVFNLGMTLTVREIKLFLDRYPSARIGYILNTATYRSGKGEHWVALEFTHGKAKLVCSQQSDFSVFRDGGELRREIHQIGYGEEWNNRLIQLDDHACGAFSAMSLLQLLRFGDIDKAVDAIGVNMENLGKDVGKPSNVDIVIDKIVGVK